MKIYMYLLFSLFFSLALRGQETFQPKQMNENVGIIYNQEFAVGIRMHTHGWAAGVIFGDLRTYYLTEYMHFEFCDLKHAKELRQSFQTPSALHGCISPDF